MATIIKQSIPPHLRHPRKRSKANRNSFRRFGVSPGAGWLHERLLFCKAGLAISKFYRELIRENPYHPRHPRATIKTGNGTRMTRIVADKTQVTNFCPTLYLEIGEYCRSFVG